MKKPRIEFVPLRSAISSDSETYLDLLIKIVPPSVETQLNRQALNLGLVIDRSGSMQGKKIEYARLAASYVVGQLQERDRISVTIYDEIVEVLVPSTPVNYGNEIQKKIATIEPRGWTNLHSGWLEGSLQVSQHLQPQQLNRVLLLSDGLANAGETNPNTISHHVQGLAQRGVSTTTLGVGEDYNEDLMELMAQSGDGNYYFIESPEQLNAIFQAELQGIMATMGQKVSLGIQPGANVVLLDVFNDLDKTEFGRYKLSNLVSGNTLEVVVRLKVPPQYGNKPLCELRLAWNNSESEQRRVLLEEFSLPSVPENIFNQLPLEKEVAQKVAQYLAARGKKEAIKHLDKGEIPQAQSALRDARLQVMSAPSAADLFQEVANLDDLESDLEAQNYKRVRKSASYQSYQRRHSRPEDS